MSNTKPTIKDIMKKYGCGRSTAYLWKKNGVPIKILEQHERKSPEIGLLESLIESKLNGKSSPTFDLHKLQEVYSKHQRQIPLKILASVMKGNGERDYSLSAVSRKIKGTLPMKDFEMQRLKDFYKNTFNEEF